MTDRIVKRRPYDPPSPDKNGRPGDPNLLALEEAEAALRDEGLLIPGGKPEGDIRSVCWSCGHRGPLRRKGCVRCGGHTSPWPEAKDAADPCLLKAISALAFYSAVAHQFAKQNPNVDLAFGPAEGDEGKIPMKTIGGLDGFPLPLTDRLWELATGYGIRLDMSPAVYAIDVDDAEALNPQAQALLAELPALTYATRKGRHYLTRIPDGEDRPSLFLDRNFGQVWFRKKRFIALTGSKGKAFPDNGNYIIPTANLDILNMLEAELEAHPAPERNKTGGGHPGGRHGYFLQAVGEMLRRWPTIPNSDIVDNLKSSEAYQSKTAEQGEAQVIKEISRIADDFRKKQKHHQPPPSDDDPPDTAYDRVYDKETGELIQVEHSLGDLSPHGQEVLEDDDLVVGYIGQWQSQQSYQERGGRNYPAYLRFYHRNVRVALPPKVSLKSLEQVNEYLASRPPPLEVGERNIYLPPPGQYALIKGHQEQGKSWVALHILKELELPALYLDTERPEVTADRTRIFGIADRTHTHSTPSYKDLQYLANEDHRIVVVDAIGGLMPDENKASAIDDLLRVLSPVIKDRHLLLLHHLNKAGDSARGSGRIEQLASFIYEVEEEPHPKSGRLIKVKRDKATSHRHRPVGLHLRYEVIDGQVTLDASSPPSKKDRAVGHHQALTEAWKKADPANTLSSGEAELPSVPAVARQLEAQGIADTASKGRLMVEAAIGKIFKKLPGRGYQGAHPGLDLIVADKP